MPFTRKRQTTLTVLAVLLILLIIAYTARIYSIQIINADKYSANGQKSADRCGSIGRYKVCKHL